MAIRLDRRRFLALGSASLLGTGWRGSNPRPNSPMEADVVVLGAGLAGLSAAHRLRGAGKRVVVLEARDRVGGRAHTLRAFERGQYAEAGAIYVPASHDLTLRYVRAFGLELVDAAPANLERAWYLRGELVRRAGFGDPDWPQELLPEERQLGTFGMLQRYLLAAGVEAGDVLEPDLAAPRTRALDELSIAELMRQRGASDAAVEVLGLGYLQLFGDGIETVSALQCLREFAGQSGPRKSYRIAGGSERLPEAMAAELAEEIRLGLAIEALERTPAGVRAHGSTPDGRSETIRARYAVCTLPSTVTRGLRASPAWSAPKRGALDEVGSTSVTRTYLQCSTRQWQGPSGAPTLSVTTDTSWMSLNDATLMQSGPGGILESYATGAAARDLEALSVDERVRRLRQACERIFPGIEDTFERGGSHAWGSDPFALGGYAWFRPGQLTRHLAALRAPEGRVHFAGEHTSAWSAWMQGALESGERAAEEVLARDA